MNDLHYASYCGDIKSLANCLERGMDPNERDNYRGYTALHWLIDMLAVDGPRMEMMKLLISYGADPNAVATDEYKSTPLTLAAEAGTSESEKMTSALLKSGACT